VALFNGLCIFNQYITERPDREKKETRTKCMSSAKTKQGTDITKNGTRPLFSRHSYSQGFSTPGHNYIIIIIVAAVPLEHYNKSTEHKQLSAAVDCFHGYSSAVAEGVPTHQRLRSPWGL